MAEESVEGAELIARHQEVTKKLRIASIAFPVVVMVIIAWNLSAMADQVREVDTKAVAAELADQSSALLPDVEHHLGLVAADVQPALADALQTQTQAMGPEIERRLEADMKKLASLAEADFRRAVERSLERLDAQQREILVEELPVLADDEAAQDKVLEAVHDALSTWAVRQLDSTFDKHLVAMEKLRGTLDKSFVTEDAAPADPADALMIWLDLLNEKLGAENATIVDGAEPTGNKRK